jgi:hypothetical protein
MLSEENGNINDYKQYAPTHSKNDPSIARVHLQDSKKPQDSQSLSIDIGSSLSQQVS